MSYYFNGTDSELYGYEIIPTFATPYTFSCWINTPTVTAATDRTLVRLGLYSALASNRSVARIFIDTSNRLVCQVADTGAANASTSTNTISANRWHHCAGMFRSSTFRQAFLDGTAATSNTTSRTVPTGANSLSIATSFVAATPQFFDGLMADVAIWSADLAPSEILSLSKGVPASFIRPSELRFHYSFMGRGLKSVASPDEVIKIVKNEAPNRRMYISLDGIEGGDSIINGGTVLASANEPPVFTRKRHFPIYKFANIVQATNVPVLYRQRQMQGMAA